MFSNSQSKNFHRNLTQRIRGSNSDSGLESAKSPKISDYFTAGQRQLSEINFFPSNNRIRGSKFELQTVCSGSTRSTLSIDARKRSKSALGARLISRSLNFASQAFRCFRPYFVDIEAMASITGLVLLGQHYLARMTQKMLTRKLSLEDCLN